MVLPIGGGYNAGYRSCFHGDCPVHYQQVLYRWLRWLRHDADGCMNMMLENMNPEDLKVFAEKIMNRMYDEMKKHA